jgi:hypothetical protein
MKKLKRSLNVSTIGACEFVFKRARFTDFLAIIRDEHLLTNAKLRALTISLINIPFLALMGLFDVADDLVGDGGT